ncbi:MAG: VanZ family protein, partial [Bacillota bacterium]|nr:VanZ family protein [Bacillota bacterium]
MKKIISWVAVLFWMVLIFNLSSQAAEKSNQLSTGITKTVFDTVKKVCPNINFDIDSLNQIIRKDAHFFAYLVLGLLVLNALRRSGLYGYKCILIALLICVLYAISDEVHQLYVPGRGPSVKDVLIDSSGSLIGTGFYIS